MKEYLAQAKQLGFDVIELSTGFISLPDEDLHRLLRDVQNVCAVPAQLAHSLHKWMQCQGCKFAGCAKNATRMGCKFFVPYRTGRYQISNAKKWARVEPGTEMNVICITARVYLKSGVTARPTHLCDCFALPFSHMFEFQSHYSREAQIVFTCRRPIKHLCLRKKFWTFGECSCFAWTFRLVWRQNPRSAFSLGPEVCKCGLMPRSV